MAVSAPGFTGFQPEAMQFLVDLADHKDLTFGRRLTDEESLSPDLPDILADDYTAAVPVFRFLATLRAASASG